MTTSAEVIAARLRAAQDRLRVETEDRAAEIAAHEAPRARTSAEVIADRLAESRNPTP